MRRIQIHIEEDLDDALALQATREHTSKAALIRRYVAEHVNLQRPEVDPIDRIVGTLPGSADDVDIDDVVYGT